MDMAKVEKEKSAEPGLFNTKLTVLGATSTLPRYKNADKPPDGGSIT